MDADRHALALGANALVREFQYIGEGKLKGYPTYREAQRSHAQIIFEDDLPGSVEGYHVSPSKGLGPPYHHYIVLSSKFSGKEAEEILAHELAHEELHTRSPLDNRTRLQMELEARLRQAQTWGWTHRSVTAFRDELRNAGRDVRGDLAEAVRNVGFDGSIPWHRGTRWIATEDLEDVPVKERRSRRRVRKRPRVDRPRPRARRRR